MHPFLFEVCMASRILNIVRGDSYPFLDNSYTIRLIDKNTGELTNYDFLYGTGCSYSDHTSSSK